LIHNNQPKFSTSDSYQFNFNIFFLHNPFITGEIRKKPYNNYSPNKAQIGFAETEKEAIRLNTGVSVKKK